MAVTTEYKSAMMHFRDTLPNDFLKSLADTTDAKFKDMLKTFFPTEPPEVVSQVAEAFFVQGVLAGIDSMTQIAIKTGKVPGAN